MANVQYYDVILKPVITEKSMNIMAEKKYTFLVHPEANKAMIKEAVEKMFDGVKVAKVNTMNCEGKTKRRGTLTNLEIDWEKISAAVVDYLKRDSGKLVNTTVAVSYTHLWDAG